MRLKLGDWAQIAEIISAVAVILSLIYVGYQINENTNEIRAANRQQLVNRAVAATREFATNREMAEVLAKVNAGEELTLHEESQYHYVIRSVLYDVQEAFLLHAEGRLDNGYWQTREALIVSYIYPPKARSIYNENKSNGVLHQGFVNWLDSRLLRKDAESVDAT